ncbi:MAG TPA: ATP-binding cassette domain-containing protein, partial [Alphaproteobacteria bacterium]|nr:ATP-binding cassette domain-containing protein [Alphaproteobacteria bacterium]
MIEVQALTKHFGPIVAVDQVSFAVGRGEVLGFLGPNGAGKSTTMKMIAGFLTPTSGSAKVCGFDVLEQPIEVKTRIGYLPEGAPLYADMTPKSFLAFIASARGFGGQEAKRRIALAAEQTQILAVFDRPIDTLSKGYKRRVGLAQALLHDPEVLILDEPTDGLDPNQKHEVRTLIREMAPRKTIVISTHLLDEVSAVCTRAIVIAGGRLAVDTT